MIKTNEIMDIEGKKMFFDTFEVVKAGAGVWSIMGWDCGTKERKFTGYADEVAEWLNGYFGLRGE